MKISNGLSEKNLKGSSVLLTAVLADEMILYIKTRKFHWNVSGESFMELHKLFEHQYKELEEIVDEVAERINKSGEKTIGTLKEFIQHTKLQESAGKYPSQKEMLKELLSDHEIICSSLRNNIDDCSNKFKDAGTADLLTRILQQHETTAWILRRYLN